MITPLTERTNADLNDASDINQLNQNNVDLQSQVTELTSQLELAINMLSKPKYKNLSVINTPGSETTSLTISWDELQVGNIREENFNNGNPLSITISSDMDTGTAPDNGTLFIWVYAGAGKTTICRLSVSDTLPQAIEGYTDFLCISGLKIVAGNLITILQKDNMAAYGYEIKLLNDDNDSINSLNLSDYIPISIIKNFTINVSRYSGSPGFYIYYMNTSLASVVDILDGISYQTKNYIFNNIGNTLYSQRFPGTSGEFEICFKQVEINF